MFVNHILEYRGPTIFLKHDAIQRGENVKYLYIKYLNN